MQVALTEFWMLHGFRPVDAVQATLDATGELGALASRLRSTAGTASEAVRLRQLYEHVMTLPQDSVDAVLAPLGARLTPR